MAEYVRGYNVSDAWLNAASVLSAQPGLRLPHMVVTIADPTAEDPLIRQQLTTLLDTHGHQSIETVAGTLFPASLYHGKGTASDLYLLYQQAIPVLRRMKGNVSGTYFERMISYPIDAGGRLNQLERAVGRMSSALAQGIGSRNAHAQEIALSAPASDHDLGDVRISCPAKDNGLVSFPCLSHISLTLEHRVVHMCAVYRSHYYVTRAYGNYVGLGRLLQFLAVESGAIRGELTCISTLAQVASAECSKAELLSLVSNTKSGA